MKKIFSYFTMFVLIFSFAYAIECKPGYVVKDGKCIQCGDDIFPPIEESTLKEYAEKRGLFVGALVDKCLWKDDQEICTDTLASEFDVSAVQGSVLMKVVEPDRDEFDFHLLDQRIQFAQDNDLKLIGYHLLYRAQSSPAWLYPDQTEQSCGEWTPEELEEILTNYITTTVEYGGEDFIAWSVVNEVFDYNGNFWDRCSYKIMGNDSFRVAFRAAHAANPDAILFWNDNFNGLGGPQSKGKVDAFFKLVKKLKSEDVPIDAVGNQMHLDATKLPSNYKEDFQYFMDKAEDANVDVIISEMDVYEGPDDNFEKQKEIYKTITEVCLDYSNCLGIITWGLPDSYTWLHQRWSTPLPDADPLLFDTNYERKSAYYGLIEAINETQTESRTCIKGDLNVDDVIDMIDLDFIIEDFGKDSNFYSGSDINQDNTIDIFDFVLVARDME